MQAPGLLAEIAGTETTSQDSEAPQRLPGTLHPSTRAKKTRTGVGATELDGRKSLQV